MVVAVLLVASGASAGVPATREAWQAALADPVSVRALVFGNDYCDAKFGHPQLVRGDERNALIDCIDHLGASELPFTATLDDGTIVLIDVAVRDGRIVAIGSDQPTIVRREHLEPSDATKDAIAKRGAHAVTWFEVCHAASGAVTSRRIIAASGIAEFDREVAAHFGASATKPRALCEIVVADSDPPPPPPPAPSPPPSIVPPAALEAMRTAGAKQIDPDDATKRQIADAGKSRVIGTFKLCLDATGAFTDVHLIKSTGFADYDNKIVQTMTTTWRYRPFLVNGTPSPVCTAVTFIYSSSL